jgi:hypothetical protein
VVRLGRQSAFPPIGRANICQGPLKRKPYRGNDGGDLFAVNLLSALASRARKIIVMCGCDRQALKGGP